MTKLGICDVCGDKSTHVWKCDKHYFCDDCGSTERLCFRIGSLLCDECHSTRVKQKIKSFKGDTEYTTNVVCPWCGYESDSGFEMSEGENECGECENTYSMSRDVEVTYSTSRANP